LGAVQGVRGSDEFYQDAQTTGGALQAFASTRGLTDATQAQAGVDDPFASFNPGGWLSSASNLLPPYDTVGGASGSPASTFSVGMGGWNFGTSILSLFNKPWYGNYLGPGNYGYDVPPINALDNAARNHDLAYEAAGIENGFWGALTNTSV